MSTSPIEWGVASAPRPGEKHCGDAHLVQAFEGGVLVAAVDGVGHGKEAAEAARICLSTLAAHSGTPILPLLERCHEKLAGSRGVAISLASLSWERGTISWAGIGNVEAVLMRATGAPQRRREFLMLRGGLLGERLPAVKPVEHPIARGDTLILATDGVRSEFSETPVLTLPPQRLAEMILRDFSRGTDDALALVLRYLG